MKQLKRENQTIYSLKQIRAKFVSKRNKSMEVRLNSVIFLKLVYQFNKSRIKYSELVIRPLRIMIEYKYKCSRLLLPQNFVTLQ